MGLGPWRQCPVASDSEGAGQASDSWLGCRQERAGNLLGTDLIDLLAVPIVVASSAKLAECEGVGKDMVLWTIASDR